MKKFSQLIEELNAQYPVRNVTEAEDNPGVHLSSDVPKSTHEQTYRATHKEFHSDLRKVTDQKIKTKFKKDFKNHGDDFDASWKKRHADMSRALPGNHHEEQMGVAVKHMQALHGRLKDHLKNS